MKVKMWTVLLTQKARNYCHNVDHCQDKDNCQYHPGIDHCLDGSHSQDRDPSQNGNDPTDDRG